MIREIKSLTLEPTGFHCSCVDVTVPCLDFLICKVGIIAFVRIQPVNACVMA